jgi:A118 family predicted phage portal protein
MTKVTFWTELEVEETNKNNKIYRLLETYEKGRIITELYEGVSDKLGKKIDLNSLEETQDIEELVQTPDALFAVYIPNAFPNRIARSSYQGRSDYLGVEGLMDSLDETFTSWQKDVKIAKGKILVPESFLMKNGDFNDDQDVFVKLAVDPIAESGKMITATQFDIRAEKFEKTAQNLLERIITSAGYSPQSFGLNIQGRAESGTALSLRERKSFATKNKKSQYWQSAIKKIIQLLILGYSELGGNDIELDSNVNVAISDGITNNLNEIASSVKILADALAASIETRVSLIHPEWTKKQIATEVQKIKDENSMAPLDNPDLDELENGNEDDLEDEE